MTRTEAKCYLQAWRRAAQTMAYCEKRLRSAEYELSLIPSLSVAVPDESNELTPNGERVGVFTPKGNATSDPTGRDACKRAGISSRMKAIGDDLEAVSSYYYQVLAIALDQMDQEKLQLLHSYYCVGKGVRALYPVQRTFYRKLRDAVTDFQRVTGLPEIPEQLREEETHHAV